MLIKACESCGNKFEVEEQYSNNKLCRSCFFKQKEAYNGNGAKPANTDRTDVIIKQTIWKCTARMLPKRTSPEKFAEYADKLLKLFHRNI